VDISQKRLGLFIVCWREGLGDGRKNLSVTPVDTGWAPAGRVPDASVFSGLFQQENGKTVD
jgi:hypothetical protein